VSAAREPEDVRAGVIAAIGAATVALTALLVALAWLLVAPPPAARHPTLAPSPLEHALFDRATGGTDARAAGARQLERAAWIDRGAGVVRIPIARAIDAVVADPGLIGGAR
jgi:hypothetical protein